MWLSATLLLGLSVSGYSQTSNQNPEFVYHVKIQEILSEEDAKNFDFVLRPLFDVAPTFDEQINSLVYRTNARLTLQNIAPKLAEYGLHVEDMTVTTIHPSNQTTKD